VRRLYSELEGWLSQGDIMAWSLGSAASPSTYCWEAHFSKKGLWSGAPIYTVAATMAGEPVQHFRSIVGRRSGPL
jgi:hypothetical protein